MASARVSGSMRSASALGWSAAHGTPSSGIPFVATKVPFSTSKAVHASISESYAGERFNRNRRGKNAPATGTRLSRHHTPSSPSWKVALTKSPDQRPSR